MSSSVCSQSFSTEPSLSPSHLQDLNINYDQEERETAVDRENSFEDLEQFLSQLNWAPPHGSTDDYSSNPEPLQLEQSEGYHQEVEMRALKEHLKAIVKDIHIAIGESHMCNTQYLLYIMHPSTFPCLLLIFIYTFLTRILAQNHKILCQYTIQGLGESSCLSCQMPYVQTKPSHSCTSTCLCPTNCFL